MRDGTIPAVNLSSSKASPLKSSGVSAALTRAVGAVSTALAMEDPNDEKSGGGGGKYTSGAVNKVHSETQRGRCGGECAAVKGFSVREGAQVGFGMAGHVPLENYVQYDDVSSSWVPFVVWLTALVLLTLMTALLVYFYLRSSRALREGYAEVGAAADSAAVAIDVPPPAAQVDGNASRKRFLESRRVEAQKSYGTGGDAS